MDADMKRAIEESLKTAVKDEKRRIESKKVGKAEDSSDDGADFGANFE